MADDPHRNVLHVKDCPFYASKGNLGAAPCDEPNNRQESRYSLRLYAKLHVNLSLSDLEERYSNACEENKALKKHTNDQEEKLKTLSTMIAHLVNERKRTIKTGEERRERSDQVDEPCVLTAELEEANRQLMNQVAELSGQLRAQRRAKSGKRYRTPSLSHNGLNPGSNNVIKRKYTDEMRDQGGTNQMADIAGLRNQVSALRQEINLLREQNLTRVAVLEAELGQAWTEDRRGQTAENMELLRLRRELRQQAGQLDSFEARNVDVESDINRMIQVLKEAQKEKEMLANQMNQERVQSPAKSTDLEPDVMQNYDQEITNMKREIRMLKDHNQNLLRHIAQQSLENKAEKLMTALSGRSADSSQEDIRASKLLHVNTVPSDLSAISNNSKKQAKDGANTSTSETTSGDTYHAPSQYQSSVIQPTAGISDNPSRTINNLKFSEISQEPSSYIFAPTTPAPPAIHPSYVRPSQGQEHKSVGTSDVEDEVVQNGKRSIGVTTSLNELEYKDKSLLQKSEQQPGGKSSSEVFSMYLSNPVLSARVSPTPMLSGRVSPTPVVSGRVSPTPMLSGRISPTPVVSGRVSPTPVASGRGCPTPMLSGRVSPTPVVSGRVSPTPGSPATNRAPPTTPQVPPSKMSPAHAASHARESKYKKPESQDKKQEKENEDKKQEQEDQDKKHEREDQDKKREKENQYKKQDNQVKKQEREDQDKKREKENQYKKPENQNKKPDNQDKKLVKCPSPMPKPPADGVMQMQRELETTREMLRVQCLINEELQLELTEKPPKPNKFVPLSSNNAREGDLRVIVSNEAPPRMKAEIIQVPPPDVIGSLPMPLPLPVSLSPEDPVPPDSPPEETEIPLPESPRSVANTSRRLSDEKAINELRESVSAMMRRNSVRPSVDQVAKEKMEEDIEKSKYVLAVTSDASNLTALETLAALDEGNFPKPIEPSSPIIESPPITAKVSQVSSGTGSKTDVDSDTESEASAPQQKRRSFSKRAPVKKLRKHEISIEIHSLSLHKSALDKVAGSTQKVYIEFKFLGMGDHELETPPELLAPLMTFNYRKVFSYSNQEKRMWLNAMAKATTMEKAVILFRIVSEPAPADENETIYCEDIAFVELDMRLLLSKQDLDHKDVPVLSSDGKRDVIGALTLSILGTKHFKPSE